MPHAKRTVTIARPPQEVFDYLAGGTYNPEWRAGVLEIERTPAAAGEGATYKLVLAGPGGRRNDSDYRITAFDWRGSLDGSLEASGHQGLSVSAGADDERRGLRRVAARVLVIHCLGFWMAGRFRNDSGWTPMRRTVTCPARTGSGTAPA